MVYMLSEGDFFSFTITSPAGEVYNPTYISHFASCLSAIPFDQLKEDNVFLQVPQLL